MSAHYRDIKRAYELDARTEGERGVVSARVIGYEVEDSYGDVFARGGFREWAEDFKRIGKPLPMLREHSRADIVGEWFEFEDREDGLYGKGRIYMDTNSGGDAYVHLKREVYTHVSIGARMKVSDIEPIMRGDTMTGERILKATLKEVSLTLAPANDKAEIESVKSDGYVDRSELRALLRTKYSSNQVTRLMDGGFAEMVRGQDNARDGRDDGNGSRDESAVLDALQASLKRLSD